MISFIYTFMLSFAPMQPDLDLAIIGGGAAGFFAAIHTAEHKENARIAIFEKTNHVLSKVKISGGGACNLTTSINEPGLLAKFYPRGGKELIGPFSVFGPNETKDWFKKQGIETYARPDGRVFPTSNSSQDIIDCFLHLTKKYSIQICTSKQLIRIERKNEGFELFFSDLTSVTCKYLLLAAGGSGKENAYAYIKALGHTIIPPVPSLFTFSIQEQALRQLSGISMPDVRIKIEGTTYQHTGHVLITHWGLSGPAILQLSAYAARELHQNNYVFSIRINWLPAKKYDALKEMLLAHKSLQVQKNIGASNPYSFPQRLWIYLLTKSGIEEQKAYAACSQKEMNRILECISNDIYSVTGKSTFKEEFVTAGGVCLKEIHMKSMESKQIPNLYFAGEIMNIDALTGGFNFQAAWTSAYIAASSIAGKIKL